MNQKVKISAIGYNFEMSKLNEMYQGINNLLQVFKGELPVKNMCLYAQNQFRYHQLNFVVMCLEEKTKLLYNGLLNLQISDVHVMTI